MRHCKFSYLKIAGQKFLEKFAQMQKTPYLCNAKTEITVDPRQDNP